VKNISINQFKIIVILSSFLFLLPANAEHFTIDSADNYPYKSLVERSNKVKVFYISNDENISCRVEVVLAKMTWSSTEKEISKELFNDNQLSNCLSKEAAKRILSQTFLQFGRGL